MSFIQPVTDRSEVDVKDVENKIPNDKGALSFTMLNRIENNTQHLASLLTMYGYPITLEVKTDWSREDYFRPSDLDRIKGNIMALKEVYVSYSTTPELALGRKSLDYQTANDMEQIELDLQTLITNMSNYYVHSGVSASGQTRMFQNRFRRM